MSRGNKTRVFITIVILANVIGNSSLSRGMHQVGETVSASPFPYLLAMRNPWVVVGMCLLLVWLFSLLSLLSWADLSYVLPVTAIGYVLTALSGTWLLGEHVSITRWAGILLITAGAAIVARTSVRTTPARPDLQS